MPPKVKITKEEIITAAVCIVRTKGAQAINARNIAAHLGCSTQPIFSNFKTMEDLFFAVVSKADELCNEYIAREVQEGKHPAYKASGIAYIRFAKEEKELFKLLYMRDRTCEPYQKDIDDHKMINLVQSNTGMDEESAKLFHLEMWAYVHGIAAMYATGFLDLEWELVSKMLTDSYQGLRKQYGME